MDEGEDSHGERYLEIRDRLVRYFSRRQCPHPEDLADETLNRVTRRLEESGAIESGAPARYCYIVAKFVLLESLRRHDRHAITRTREQTSHLHQRHPTIRHRRANAPTGVSNDVSPSARPTIGS